MTMYNKGTSILITDPSRASVCNCDLDGNYKNKANLDSFLQKPLAICTSTSDNGDEEIYIYDGRSETVFVYNCEFKLMKSIGDNLESVFDISVDCERNILYCSHDEYDEYDVVNLHKIQLNECFYPHSLHLSSDSNIYTLAYELDKSKSWSENRFLFIIDSKNHKIKQKIK